MEGDWEVGLLPHEKMRKFIIWYDDHIGTEYDLTEHDDELTFLVAFSITESEFNKLWRKFKTMGGISFGEFERQEELRKKGA